MPRWHLGQANCRVQSPETLTKSQTRVFPELSVSRAFCFLLDDSPLHSFLPPASRLPTSPLKSPPSPLILILIFSFISVLTDGLFASLSESSLVDRLCCSGAPYTEEQLTSEPTCKSGAGDHQLASQRRRIFECSTVYA